MSLSGTTNTYLPPTLDGLTIIDADAIYINGIPIDTENLVPYTNATKNVNLGTFNFQTLGSVSAKQHLLPSFESTMMTGPTTSSIFYADAWSMTNTLAVSSLVSTSYLRFTDVTNASTLLTLQSDGIADFANSKVRVSTMAINAYDVVNLSTLTSAVAFIENVNALNYVPYTGATNDLNMGASTITTSGLMSAGALRITSSISNVDYSVSVNSTDFLEFTNLLSNQKVYTDGDSFWIPNRLFCNSTIYTNDIQMGNTIYFAYGTGQQWGTNLNGSGEYVIQDDVGDTRLKLSKSTGLTISTLNVTAVPSGTPSLALGITGGQVVSFAVPSAGGTVNTSTTTARFIPYLSTATTLTNSLLNQIDDDSMGFGYTTIPNYPLGAGGKNMYINGSIFAGALNSMFATFGRDTNTSNPANEITFTAGGAGILLSQIKSHSGSSPFVDATWTYSNTNPAPLGANQGQVLLTANKMTMSADLTVNGDFRKQGGNSGANWFSLRGTDTLNSPYLEFFVANLRRSYIGFATVTSMNVFTENGANLELGTEGVTRMVINTAGDASFTGNVKVGVAKRLILDGTGATEIYNGQIDTYNPTGNNNLMIRSWWGIGFPSYDNIVRIGMDTRTGNAGFSGTVSVAGLVVNGGSTTHTSGDNSYMTYGPNATWNANLVVGASPDRSGVRTGQIVVTNGNLHADAGNSNDIYYGFYANQRGTPNVHRFYGGDYNFVAVPQNFDAYAHVCVFAGDQMRRSQCMMRQIYREESIAWTGGVNMTYAFYKYNAQCPVKISGKYSMYSTYVGIQNVGMRLYSQTSGAYFYYNFRTYQNITIAQTTYPFELILTAGDLGAFSTGWFDIYIYGVAGQCQSDGNNQLHVCVQVLPVDAF